MSKSQGALAVISLSDLEKRVGKALDLVDAIEDVLPALTALTDEERRSSDGRLRNGESVALVSILDVADAAPSSFTVLADKDGGKDPKKFETEFLRDALARAAALDKLATELESLARDVRDSQLALGGTARRATLAAYEIAKPLAKHDDGIRTKLAGALDFYGAPARQGAKTRAQKRNG